MSYPIVYTIDPPSADPAYNKRLGYRTPRSVLLPPYLMVNQYFIDYCDALDDVMGPEIDQKTDILANLRNMWVTNPSTEQEIQDAQILDFGDWSQPEREILVKQVNMLGLKLASSGVISNDGYHAISRFLGQYWFEKGTDAFIEFINFCLGAKLTIAKMWTEDYQTFVPVENDDPMTTPGIGTPIWQGGTWYPTTHVQIVAAGGLDTLDFPTLVAFFYEIANYNLVLYGIDLSFDMNIVDDPTNPEQKAHIVAVSLLQDNEIVISNKTRYGANVPATYEVAPDLPTRVLMVNPADVNYTQQYLMGAPSSWMQDADGDTIPLYQAVEQTATQAQDLPTALQGGASTTGDMSGYVMLYGPVNWVRIPGADPSTTTRVPAFATVPTERTVSRDSLSTQMVGNQRNYALVNPKGFKQYVSGQWTPYW